MTEANDKFGPLYDQMNWREHAACRELDTNVFFPVGNSGSAVEEIALAKRICASCVVRSECLAFALETKQENGVWGGTSEAERRAHQKAERRRRSA